MKQIHLLPYYTFLGQVVEQLKKLPHDHMIIDRFEIAGSTRRPLYLPSHCWCPINFEIVPKDETISFKSYEVDTPSSMTVQTLLDRLAIEDPDLMITEPGGVPVRVSFGTIYKKYVEYRFEVPFKVVITKANPQPE